MSIFSRKTVEVQEPLFDHTIYLIDTENVRTVWTLLLDRMTVNDKIYVFYTMNSGNVSYEDLNGVLSSGKSVELIQCHTGKNGLDFQLVSYLGYLIRNNENADYCIISDDSGYDAVIKFWEGRDVDVTRKTAFQVSGKQAKPAKKPLFGSKSRTKSQAAKQTDVKAATEASKVSSQVKVQVESDKASNAAKPVRAAKSKSVTEKKVADESDNIFRDEPVRMTPVNLDQIKLINQPKKDGTMQSSADMKTTDKKTADKKASHKRFHEKNVDEKKSVEVISTEKQLSDVNLSADKLSSENSSDMNLPDETTTDDKVSVKKSSESKSSGNISSERKQSAKKPRTSSKQESGEAAKQDTSKAASKPVIPASPEMLSKLRELLPEEPDDRIREISEIISKSGKNGLADIHDDIEKLYRNEMASDIYRTIRRNIKDICC